MNLFIGYLITILLITIYITYINYTYKLNYGPKGPKGDKGIKGDKGPKGDNGNEGLYGDKGSKGFESINFNLIGPKGIKGIKGDIGPIGIRGYRGFKGDKGEIGERGSKGLKGLNGPTGYDGPRGNSGEYDYSLIDEKKCKIIPINFMKTIKCPYEYILTGIIKEDNIYSGKCCPIILNNECKDKPLAQKLNKFKGILVGTEYESKNLTKEEQEIKNRYEEIYKSNYVLFYKGEYKCDDNLVPNMKGSVTQLRCCMSDNMDNDEKLNYLKLY